MEKSKRNFGPTLIGFLVFSEPVTLLSGLGIILILAAVVLLNMRKQNNP